MVIKVLCENIPVSGAFSGEHGLSLYIETGKHRILFDTGATSLFLENAAKLNVDIKSVDTLIISHGHDDHGGGLRAFLQKNDKARIYIHKDAFLPHFSRRADGLHDISLDKSLAGDSRIIYTDGHMVLDDEMFLFSDIKTSDFMPEAGRNLLANIDGEIKKDDFSHEQDLVVKSGGKTVLFTGCAHRGIVNILNRFSELFGCPADAVVGGFHIASPSGTFCEEDALIQGIANHMNRIPSRFYTCHCTGKVGFDKLSRYINGDINYLHCGEEIEI